MGQGGTLMVILVRVWYGWSLIGFKSSVLGRVKDQFGSLNIKLYLESSGNVFMPLPTRVRDFSKDTSMYT